MHSKTTLKATEEATHPLCMRLDYKKHISVYKDEVPKTLAIPFDDIYIPQKDPTQGNQEPTVPRDQITMHSSLAALSQSSQALY